MAVLGVGLSSVLALANKRLHVYEDPRIDEVDELLPQAHCGACGFPGCRAFAEALAEGNASPAQCTASSADAVADIAAVLGIEAGTRDARTARCACAGGNREAREVARYRGIETCRAATLVSGGGKACPWGCLGFGDCAAACPFDAIRMDADGLPVVDEDRCTACGECVVACPKDLFSLQDQSHRLWVACSNHLMGKEVRANCDVACIACRRCAKDAAEGLISMEDNLAVVDYSKNETASLDAIQGCPTGAIVWLDKEKGVIKGEKALEPKEDKASAKAKPKDAE